MEGGQQQGLVLPSYQERVVETVMSPSEGSAVLYKEQKEEGKGEMDGHGVMELDSQPVRSELSGERKG